MPLSEKPKTDRKRKSTMPSLSRQTAKDSMRVSETDIALKAFAYYCERGCRHGADVDDWLRAERELLGRSEPSKRGAGRHGAAAQA